MEPPSAKPSSDQATVRLAVWLGVACLFKTRSEAQKAIGNGKIAVNAQPAKAVEVKLTRQQQQAHSHWQQASERHRQTELALASGISPQGLVEMVR